MIIHVIITASITNTFISSIFFISFIVKHESSFVIMFFLLFQQSSSLSRHVTRSIYSPVQQCDSLSRPRLLSVRVLPGQVRPVRGHSHHSGSLRSDADQQVCPWRLWIRWLQRGRPRHIGPSLFGKTSLQHSSLGWQLRQCQTLSWRPEELPWSSIWLRQR